ncbi:MAG: hypothetical protein ACXQTP_07235 [Candidatus Methanofastidiosia archaeon]
MVGIAVVGGFVVGDISPFPSVNAIIPINATIMTITNNAVNNKYLPEIPLFLEIKFPLASGDVNFSCSTSRAFIFSALISTYLRGIPLSFVI